MSALHCRKSCWIGLVLMVAWRVGTGTARAQPPDPQLLTPSSLAAITARVPIGGVVHVTDSTDRTTKGRLAVVTDHEVQINVEGHTRSLIAHDIRRIQWQRPDSPITGVLIGAAVGAVPGIYWLIVDPNECSGMCPEEYALIGIGAVVGGLIDHAITRKVTVYSGEAPSGRAKSSVAIGPLVVRNRLGVRVAVKF
jgi:hypothetical protein